MSTYSQNIDAITKLRADQGSAWDAIDPEYAARMRAQNRFQTGLEIAKYTAKIMRDDMATTMQIALSTLSLWVAGTGLSASRR